MTTCSGRRVEHADRHRERAVGIAMALGLALLVNADIRGRDIYRTIIFLSYPLMTVAVGDHLAVDVRRARRPLQLRRRASLHLVDTPIPFLNSFTWALPSVIAANIWQMLGFYMIILLTGLQNIPQQPLRAAAIDGAAPAINSAASRCRSCGRRCSCASSSECSIPSRASTSSM